MDPDEENQQGKEKLYLSAPHVEPRLVNGSIVRGGVILGSLCILDALKLWDIIIFRIEQA